MFTLRKNKSHNRGKLIPVRLLSPFIKLSSPPSRNELRLEVCLLSSRNINIILQKVIGLAEIDEFDDSFALEFFCKSDAQACSRRVPRREDHLTLYTRILGACVVALTKYNETKDGRHVLLHPQGMLGQAFTTHDVTSLTMHDVTPDC